MTFLMWLWKLSMDVVLLPHLYTGREMFPFLLCQPSCEAELLFNLVGTERVLILCSEQPWHPPSEAGQPGCRWRSVKRKKVFEHAGSVCNAPSLLTTMASKFLLRDCFHRRLYRGIFHFGHLQLWHFCFFFRNSTSSWFHSKMVTEIWDMKSRKAGEIHWCTHKTDDALSATNLVWWLISSTDGTSFEIWMGRLIYCNLCLCTILTDWAAIFQKFPFSFAPFGPN
jgi:hypothetical protein